MTAVNRFEDKAAALDREDALADVRDRIFGLRCAIYGAYFASDADRAGLLRLVEDVVAVMGARVKSDVRL